MQNNQYEYTKDLKYGDNQEGFIILWLKKKKKVKFLISDQIS